MHQNKGTHIWPLLQVILALISVITLVYAEELRNISQLFGGGCHNFSPLPVPAPPPRHLFPRKIHQSWKTCQAFKLPAHRLFTSLWRQQYPDWEYTCWDDEANRNLVATAMPQFLEAYEGYTQGVEKADFTRAIYMYVHGGLYVDYDFLPVGRMDSYLESLGEYGIVLGAMGKCKD